MIQHLKKYAAFYIPYLIFFNGMLILLVFYSKAELHLLMTSINSTVTDLFFKYYTEVGASVPFWAVIVLLFYKYRAAIFVLTAQLSTGLIVQIMKRIWNEPRPVKYFANHYPDVRLHEIPGVELHVNHSFPSGHTAAAFAFFLALAFFSKRPAIHFIAFLLAILVAFSRVYLSQHFAVDLVGGSMVAVTTTTLLYYAIRNKELKWAEGSLRDVFFRKKD